jgi:signal transduction histidine kinase
MAGAKYKRKKILINPHYQLKIAITLVLSFIVYSIILAFVIFYPLSQEFYASVNIHDQARISEQVLGLHTRLWPAIFIVAILIGIQIIIKSHRLFGPVYRFEKTIKGYLTGDFSERIYLRKHDEFKEMGALINDLADYIEGAKGKSFNLQDSSERRLKIVLELIASKNETKIKEAELMLNDIIKEIGISKESFI